MSISPILLRLLRPLRNQQQAEPSQQRRITTTNPLHHIIQSPAPKPDPTCQQRNHQCAEDTQDEGSGQTEDEYAGGKNDE
ncbi:hypothetical protein F66182_11241 [Fusarium sp. NRRL 66182]|nr:hypothetical protein F66182_11241 [Fusarium sp. NRRL 66182]